MMSLLCVTGIRRQPRHPLPRDVGQEREQCRAGLPHHGAPDQGAHGQHDGQQQADGASGPGAGRAVGQCRRVLLDRPSIARSAEEDGYDESASVHLRAGVQRVDCVVPLRVCPLILVRLAGWWSLRLGFQCISERRSRSRSRSSRSTPLDTQHNGTPRDLSSG